MLYVWPILPMLEGRDWFIPQDWSSKRIITISEFEPIYFLLFFQQDMPTMRVLTKHNAESDDEISVSRGDLVQLLSVDHAANRLLVFKPAFINTPAAEGWLPGLSLGETSSMFANSVKWYVICRIHIQGALFSPPQSESRSCPLRDFDG